MTGPSSRAHPASHPLGRSHQSRACTWHPVRCFRARVDWQQPISAEAGRRAQNPGCRRQPQLSPLRKGVTPVPHPFPQQTRGPSDLGFVETWRSGAAAASWRAYKVRIQDLAPRAAELLDLGRGVGAARVLGYLFEFPKRVSCMAKGETTALSAPRCDWWICLSNWED